MSCIQGFRGKGATYLGMAVPNSRYTAAPEIAMKVPNSHNISERPALPVNCMITPGVAKTPVPMIRLKIRNVALTPPIRGSMPVTIIRGLMNQRIYL